MKYIAGIFLGAIIFAIAPSYPKAHQTSGIAPNMCGDYVSMEKRLLEQDKENVVLSGLTANYMRKEDGKQPRKIEVWMNLDTGRYTILLVDVDTDFSCILDAGRDMKIQEKPRDVGTDM